MTPIWSRIAETIAAQGAAALVSVAAVAGSAPREAGARMVVRPDGGFWGTIGGGALEWVALAEARAALAAGRGPAVVTDRPLGPDLGQCCGGRVVTLVEIFDARDTGAVRAFADGEAAGVFEAIAVIAPDGRIERSVVHPYPRLLPSGERGAAARSASRLSANSGVIPGAPQAREGDPGAGSKDGPAPAMNSGGGGAMAPGSPSRPAAPAAGDDTPQFASASSVPKATRWPHGLAPLFPLRERFGDERTPVLLFGAGHVGRALALALAPVPFRVRWVDTRPEAFPAHVPANAETVLTQDAPGEAVAAEAGALVMVMTHSHPLDLAIIDAALRRDDLGGVGLIGSATKRARFIGRLREAGLTEGQIARLTCPIGVPGIGGREPAVIAAAVAAQLLQWREAGAVRAGAPPAPRHRAGGQR